MFRKSSCLKDRDGAALILVLGVLVVCAGLVAGMQHRLAQRTALLSQEEAEVELRAALVLALQEGMAQWAADEDLTVDAPGEDWMTPKEWTSSSGVTVRMQLVDAQDRFNLNHLGLPVMPGQPRSFLDIFEDLLDATASEVKPADWDSFRSRILEGAFWVSSVDALPGLAPEAVGWAGYQNHVVALPHPKSRPLPLNINTVQPEVLQSLVGDSLRGWVQTVLSSREQEPIRNEGEVVRFLPIPVQPLLMQVLDVRTEYAELRAVAEFRNTRRELTAWLHRGQGGGVEVVRCRW